MIRLTPFRSVSETLAQSFSWSLRSLIASRKRTAAESRSRPVALFDAMSPSKFKNLNSPYENLAMTLCLRTASKFPTPSTSLRQSNLPKSVCNYRFFNSAKEERVISRGNLFAVNRWNGCKSATAASIRRTFSSPKGQQMSRSKVAIGAPWKTRHTPPITTKSSPPALSRVSSASSFWGMSTTNCLNLQQEINYLLMLSESLLRG